jgi:hypothetical protein
VALLTLVVLAFALTSTATTADAATAPSFSLVSLAVVPCSLRNGTSAPPPSPPTTLLASISRRDAPRLSFYSDGTQTVLGPRGWACQALAAGDGSQAIEVYPAGSAAADDLPSPTTPDQSVYAVNDYTGHGPGAQRVCALFPQSPAVAFLNQASLPCPPLPGDPDVTSLGPDAVTFKQADGRVGIAVYPQIGTEPPGGVPIALASCRVVGTRGSLCHSVMRDFAVREYPATPAG